MSPPSPVTEDWWLTVREKHMAVLVSATLQVWQLLSP